MVNQDAGTKIMLTILFRPTAGLISMPLLHVIRPGMKRNGIY